MSSSLGPELETAISEDYGFKKLGQTVILPSYDEKLPYASLQNLDISNCASLYAACSGAKIVIGKLQQLRDHVQNDSEFDISFLWERECVDVIAVKLIRDKELVYVNRAGQVFSLDLKQLGDPQEVYTFSEPLVLVKWWRNCALFALDSQNRLRSYHLGNKKFAPLLDHVASFDLVGDLLCVLDEDYSVQTHVMQSSHTMRERSKFSAPTELLDEIGNGYSALCITAFSERQYQLVLGVMLSETEEDVSYDHKIYVVGLSEKGKEEKATFQESFDMTPAFGSVLRYPTYYSAALPGILKSEQQPVNILASSCSSEVTIWDSEKVIQPAQDGERAVLPISKVTDNDTNPVGMALDVATDGTIAQPCSGVDAVDKLPLIYILNNEGSLQIVGVYHSTAIKQGNFSLATLNEAVASNETAQDIGQSAVESSGNPEPSNGIEVAQPMVGGSSSVATKSQQESKPLFGGFGQSASMKPKTELFGKPFSGDTNTTQQPVFGQPPAFGKPAFGGSAGNDVAAGSTFGKPAFGQPSFGQPSFGQTAFGFPDKEDSSPSSPAFGKPSFSSSVSSSTGFAQPLTDQNVANVSASPFGKFAANQSKNDSPFASLARNNNGPTFGVPSFGGNKRTDELLDKPKFGESPFSRFTSSSSKSESPFAPLSKTEKNPAFGTSLFGSSSAASTGLSTFGDFATNQPKSQSPFASLAKSENSSKFTAPFAGGEKDRIEEKRTLGQSAFATSLQERVSGKSASSDESEGQQDKTQDEDSEFSVPQELDDQNPTEKEIEPAVVENITKSGDNKQEQEGPESVSEEEEEEREEQEQEQGELGEKAESKGEAPDVDLSDSTIEQTPTRSGSSISSLTARIKESANISSDEVKSPIFSQQPVAREKSVSPFAKFANDLSKPSSSKFLFGQVPNLNKGGEQIKESSVDTEMPTPKAKSETLKFDFPSARKDEETQGSNVSDSPVAKGENSGSESPDQKYKANNNKETALNLCDGNKESTLGSSIEPAENSEKSKEIQEPADVKNPSLAASSGTSREESYDTLNDITAGELENAAVCAEASNQGSKALFKREKADVSLDNESFSEINKHGIQVQTSPPQLVNSGTQVVPSITKNAKCQTEPALSRESDIQSFHGDEAHLAVQYKPKPLSDYFSGATVESIRYHSQNPTLQSIEKTYHCVTAELSVLSENISNLQKFIEDQSADYSNERNENSLTNIYTWRIPEADKLYSILNERSRLLAPQFASVKSTHEKVADLTEESIKYTQDKVSNMRDEYCKLERLNHEVNDKFGDLKYHQLDKQSTLRKKMFNVSETIQHIEELLQLLKVHTIQAGSLEANPYVVKLVSEAASRETLLHDIASLREDIRNLNLKNEHTLLERQIFPIAEDIQSVEVVEVGLSLNTKRQIGELLKKRRDIEA